MKLKPREAYWTYLQRPILVYTCNLFATQTRPTN
jgi:hypothetical protein